MMSWHRSRRHLERSLYFLQEVLQELHRIHWVQNSVLDRCWPARRSPQMSRGPASARPMGGGGNQSGWRDILSSFTLRNACHLSATPSHPALGYLSDGPIFSPRPTRSVDVSGQNGLRFSSSTWPGVQNLTSTVILSIFKLFLHPICLCAIN